jgi:hypothetical protein
MTWPPPVFGHGRFGDLVAQQPQFGLDAWTAPRWIVAGHATNERDDILVQCWTAHSVASGLPAPVQAKALLMPTHDGIGLNQNNRRTPVRVKSRKQNPEEPIALPQRRSFALPA